MRGHFGFQNGSQAAYFYNIFNGMNKIMNATDRTMFDLVPEMKHNTF